MRLTVSFSLKDREFLPNSVYLVHFMFSGINFKSGQANAPRVKWWFCWCKADVDEEIMVKCMCQNSSLKIRISCSWHFSLIYIFLAEQWSIT